MVISTLAYEIGGVFLLAALFMYGTMVRGFIPDIFKNAKLAGLVVGIVALGLIAYQWFPEVSFALRSAFMPSTVTPQASALPVPAEPAPVRRQVTKQVQPAPRAVIADGPSHPPMPATIQPADSATLVSRDVRADTPEVTHAAAIKSDPEHTSEPSSENRAKRVVKSVGHFLHIGREKHDTDQPSPTERH